MDYQELIKCHYSDVWHQEPGIFYWDKGPANELPYDFRILEFAPYNGRQMWTYATCCMSQPDDSNKLELHLFSNVRDSSLIELLTTIAHYHRKGNMLALHHTINFGKAWQKESECSFGFVSLPYLDGPILEDFFIPEIDLRVKFYWLIPITEKEREFKMQHGPEALEKKFDEMQINYVDSNRNSVV